MSACISSRGEYGSHELDDAYTCTWCGVLDEDSLDKDSLLAELRQLRAECDAMRPLVEAARALLRLKDGPRDAAYETGKEPAWAALRAAVDALDAAP